MTLVTLHEIRRLRKVRPHMLHLMGDSAHRIVLNSETPHVSPTLLRCVAPLRPHAEPVGSARLPEYGRASLPFLSAPNILHLNGRPRTRARSLLLKCSGLLFWCNRKIVLK